MQRLCRAAELHATDEPPLQSREQGAKWAWAGPLRQVANGNAAHMRWFVDRNRLVGHAI